MKRLLLLTILTITYCGVGAQDHSSKEKYLDSLNTKQHTEDTAKLAEIQQQIGLQKPTAEEERQWAQYLTEAQASTQRFNDLVEYHKILSFGVKVSISTSFVSQDKKAARAYNKTMPDLSYNVGAVVEFRPLKRLSFEVNVLYSPFKFGAAYRSDVFSQEVFNKRYTIARYINVPMTINFYVGANQSVFFSAGYQRDFLLNVSDHNSASFKLTGQYNPTKDQMKEYFSSYDSAILGVGRKLKKHLYMGIYATIGISNMLNSDKARMYANLNGHMINAYAAIKF